MGTEIHKRGIVVFMGAQDGNTGGCLSPLITVDVLLLMAVSLATFNNNINHITWRAGLFGVFHEATRKCAYSAYRLQFNCVKH